MLIIDNMKSKNNFNLSLVLQLVASTSWIASVFVYGSFSAGDYLQLLAASAWTIANIFSFFRPQWYDRIYTRYCKSCKKQNRWKFSPCFNILYRAYNYRYGCCKCYYRSEYLGGRTVALIEPAVNSVWFYILHKVWKKFSS